jgi:hypothetical protein
MFSPRSRPPAVREEQLRSLRLTLNSPELAAGELPAGPARAAIALHDEREGILALSVVVQSVGSGARVCWSWDETLSPATVQTATDAALSFAESMGFLFDDDAIGVASVEVRRRALDHWWELVGWPVADAEAEIALAQPARVENDGLAPAPEAQGMARERLPLTKFRRRLGPPLAEPAAPEARRQGSALGRLRLVKRAHPGEAAERPPLWLRLLGSF